MYELWRYVFSAQLAGCVRCPSMFSFLHCLDFCFCLDWIELIEREKLLQLLIHHIIFCCFPHLELSNRWFFCNFSSYTLSGYSSQIDICLWLSHNLLFDARSFRELNSQCINSSYSNFESNCHRSLMPSAFQHNIIHSFTQTNSSSIA